MKRTVSLLGLLFLLPAGLHAREYPRYCCTDAGVLGPYDNDSVPEGGACFGTDSQGQRHEGKACSGDKKGKRDDRADHDDFPPYCCTEAGRFGPYPNDSVPEGGACFGTDSQGRRHEGKACFVKEKGKQDDSADHHDFPRYCCTDAGILGPYPNDSLPEGGACFGTDSQGQRHEGKACYRKDHAG